MNTTALWVAFSALRANPLRTLLSTLGVVIGAAALVAVLSVGDGLEGFARDSMERQGITAITIAPKTGDRIDGVFIAATSWPQFSAADLEAVRAVAPSTAQVVLSAGTAVLTPLEDGGERRGLMVRGLLATDIPQTLINDIAYGRVMSATELSGAAPVAVVSDTLARVLSGGTAEAAVGRTVRLGDRTVSVVGVTRPGPSRQLQVTVPFGMLEALATDPSDVTPRFDVIVADPTEVAAAREKLTGWAAAREGWGAQVTVSATGAQRLAQMEQGMMVFKLAMGAFASISLIVGGIGIMNVLLAAVAERTREIGIRKATGARNRDILQQFLAESIAITSVGSALGVVVGISGALLVTWVMRVRTDAPVYAAVTLQTMAICALIAVAIGAVFGMVPALRAARLSPIDAIRHD